MACGLIGATAAAAATARRSSQAQLRKGRGAVPRAGKLSAVIAVCFASVLILQAAPSGDQVAGGEAWYEPKEGDYRPEYNRDRANQPKQSFAEYYDWVKSFYSGKQKIGFLMVKVQPGWTEEGRNIVNAVVDDATKKKVRAALNSLGVLISREWAKDNGVRVINTDDLRSWGGRLKSAMRQDEGDGAVIGKEIEAIRADAKGKLEKRTR